MRVPISLADGATQAVQIEKKYCDVSFPWSNLKHVDIDLGSADGFMVLPLETVRVFSACMIEIEREKNYYSLYKSPVDFYNMFGYPVEQANDNCIMMKSQANFTVVYFDSF